MIDVSKICWPHCFLHQEHQRRIVSPPLPPHQLHSSWSGLQSKTDHGEEQIECFCKPRNARKQSFPAASHSAAFFALIEILALHRALLARGASVHLLATPRGFLEIVGDHRHAIRSRLAPGASSLHGSHWSADRGQITFHLFTETDSKFAYAPSGAVPGGYTVLLRQV
jgi:hypothetical protein